MCCAPVAETQQALDGTAHPLAQQIFFSLTLYYLLQSEIEHTVDFAPGFLLHATSSPLTMFDLRHAHPQTLIFVTLAHTGLRSKKK